MLKTRNKVVKRVLIIAMMLLFASSPVWADSDEAERVYHSGDFATALHEFQILAEQGDAKAQFYLGIMYHNGEGILKDYSEAAKWYKLAAEQGHEEAQYMLGWMYTTDFYQGVPQDYSEAVKWYRLAAEQGNVVVQIIVGNMYNTGQGVPQDYSEAVKWYRLAAEQGNAEAQNNLGSMYENSRGVTQNYVLAHMWYNLGAAQLPPGEHRDIAVSNRDIVEGKMTPEQVAEAQRLAREWKPKTE